MSVALVTQHAKCMRRNILSSTACPALPYFSTLSHKRHDFRGKNSYWTKTCVFWFSLQLLSETFLILRRTESDIIINVNRSSCKVPVNFFLMFMSPYVVIIFQYRNPNKMHMSQSLFYLTTALHVSGVTITHLQEYKTTVTTASGNRYTVLLSAAIVEELELVWVCCGWRTPPTAHSNQQQTTIRCNGYQIL